MERGEIRLVSPDPTAGREPQGTRPVLIASPAAFNRVTGTQVVLPASTGGGFACLAAILEQLAPTALKPPSGFAFPGA